MICICINLEHLDLIVWSALRSHVLWSGTIWIKLYWTDAKIAKCFQIVVYQFLLSNLELLHLTGGQVVVWKMEENFKRLNICLAAKDFEADLAGSEMVDLCSTVQTSAPMWPSWKSHCKKIFLVSSPQISVSKWKSEICCLVKKDK